MFLAHKALFRRERIYFPGFKALEENVILLIIASDHQKGGDHQNISYHNQVAAVCHWNSDDHYNIADNHQTISDHHVKAGDDLTQIRQNDQMI